MKRAAHLVFACLAILVPRFAHADAAATARGEALYKQGIALVEQAKADGDRQKYEAACEKFRQSYQVAPRPSALFSLALTEKKLGRNVVAAHDFRWYTHLADADPRWIEQANRYIRELLPDLATYTVEAPAGAELVIDGQATGDTSPFTDTIDLTPGHHVIEARVRGESIARAVDGTAGSTTTIQLELPPSAPPKPPSSPNPPAPALPVATPAPPSEAQPPAHASPARFIVAGTLGGAALVAAGVGAGFTAGASSASAREAPHSRYGCALNSPQCQDLNDTARRRLNDADASIGLYVTAGVLAASALATFLAWPSAKPSAARSWAIRVVPELGTRVRGLALIADF